MFHTNFQYIHIKEQQNDTNVYVMCEWTSRSYHAACGNLWQASKASRRVEQSLQPINWKIQDRKLAGMFPRPSPLACVWGIHRTRKPQRIRIYLGLVFAKKPTNIQFRADSSSPCMLMSNSLSNLNWWCKCQVYSPKDCAACQQLLSKS